MIEAAATTSSGTTSSGLIAGERTPVGCRELAGVLARLCAERPGDRVLAWSGATDGGVSVAPLGWQFDSPHAQPYSRSRSSLLPRRAESRIRAWGSSQLRNPLHAPGRDRKATGRCARRAGHRYRPQLGPHATIMEGLSRTGYRRIWGVPRVAMASPPRLAVWPCRARSSLRATRSVRIRATLAVPILLVVWVPGCGGGASSSVDYRPAVSQPIDTTHGTYEGVGLGDSPRDVQGRFGPAPSWNNRQPVTPLGVGPGELHGSYNCRGRGRDNFLRYHGVSFWQRGQTICSIQITDKDAETSRGVGPGDGLAVASDRYPTLTCRAVHGNSEEPSYRYCSGRVGPGVYLRVAGDPIEEIDLGNRPFSN